MPTTQEILDDVDLRYADWEPALQAVQDGHMQEHGRYLQGTVIASRTPADGATEDADRVDAKPSDERYTWKEALSKYVGIAPPGQVMGNIRIDIYEGPSGHGYVAISRHRIGTDMWVKTRNHGPETWRDRDWEVTD